MPDGHFAMTSRDAGVVVSTTGKAHRGSKVKSPGKKKSPTKGDAPKQQPAAQTLSISDDAAAAEISEPEATGVPAAGVAIASAGVLLTGREVLTFRVCRPQNGSAGMGVSLMELPATASMPARLLVINCSATGLAAKAGIQPHDELKAVGGRDVAADLRCSKRETEKYLATALGDIEFTISRKANRVPSPRSETFRDEMPSRKQQPPAGPPLNRAPTMDVVVNVG